MAKKTTAVAKEAEVIPEAAPANPEPTTLPPPDPAPAAEEKNFFADFSAPGSRFSRKLLLIPLVLILLISGYLLWPKFQSLITPSSVVDVYQPVSQEPKSMHLEINGPDDQILTTSKTLVVSGKTSPKSSVVINIQYLNIDLKDQNVGVEANSSGDFLRSVDLQPGINEISIFAFDPQGNSKTQSREVYYSEEKL